MNNSDNKAPAIAAEPALVWTNAELAERFGEYMDKEEVVEDYQYRWHPDRHEEYLIIYTNCGELHFDMDDNYIGYVSPGHWKTVKASQ